MIGLLAPAINQEFNLLKFSFIPFSKASSQFLIRQTNSKPIIQSNAIKSIKQTMNSLPQMNELIVLFDLIEHFDLNEIGLVWFIDYVSCLLHSLHSFIKWLAWQLQFSLSIHNF